jgi:hypothetical protein
MIKKMCRSTKSQSLRQVRFATWAIVVTLASFGQYTWLIRHRSSQIGLAGIIFSLATIAALLVTTPAYAIRLPRFLSEGLIVSVTIALEIAGDESHARMCLSITILLLIALRLRRISPWWAVLVAWFPHH